MQQSHATGTVGDRYVIEQHLTVGGAGRVYRVRHARLGKPYALKVLRRTFADDAAARTRFYEEARVVSSLSHPHVVSVIDFGDDPGVGVYMVMEYLGSESLRSRIQEEGPLPLKVACDVLLQVAEAVHFAHEKGIVHCDLKPENVLLCAPQPGERRQWSAKIVDFGLANTGRASEEPVAGTPEYLAPERLRGDAPTARTDIYALGVLLYEMLAGQVPFSGSVSEVIAAQLFEQPRPLSEILGTMVPSRCEQLIQRAMDKDPGLRHATAGEFLYELRALMDMLGMARRGSTVPPAPGDVSPESLRHACEAAPAGLAWLDLHGKILSANPACARLLTGDAGAAILGLYVRETAFGAARPHFTADLRRVYASGQVGSRRVPVRYLGGVTAMLEFLSPGGDSSGDVLLTIVPVEDGVAE